MKFNFRKFQNNQETGVSYQKEEFSKFKVRNIMQFLEINYEQKIDFQRKRKISRKLLCKIGFFLQKIANITQYNKAFVRTWLLASFSPLRQPYQYSQPEHPYQ